MFVMLFCFFFGCCVFDVVKRQSININQSAVASETTHAFTGMCFL